MSNLAELEEKDEEARVKLSIAEKEELIKEAKRRYGPDFGKFFGGMKSGLDWDALKFRIDSRS